METQERTSGAGYTPAHFTGAAPAASVGGPVSARPAPADNGQEAIGRGTTQQEEEGGETHRRVREGKDTSYGETEERSPPDWSRAPNASG